MCHAMWTPRWGALRVTAAPLAAPAPAALATLLLALALLTSSCQPAMSAQGNTASSSSASSFAAHVHASIGSSTTTIGTSRTSSTTTISGGPQQQFSLFLSPHGALGRQLAAEIDALAAQHPRALLPPHVTLLGLVEAEWGDMQRIAKQLARSMQRFRVNFTGVQSGSSYWQCVFLKVAENPDIMQAAAKAREAFGVPQGPYMPHLSLKYGNLDDQQRAEIVRQETERLYGEGSDTRLVDTGFEVRHVAVWYTPADDESCRAWRLVGEYRLGGDQDHEGKDALQ